MPRLSDDPETQARAQRLGAALAELRRQAGLSQAEAGAVIGMTSQGWGLYESGRRPGLFRPDVQRRLTQAVGATPEGLATVVARHDPPAVTDRADGVQATGRAFVGAGHGLRIRLEDDRLAPWAASGVVLELRSDVKLRPGQGCVLDLIDGSRRIGLFKGEDEKVVRLTLALDGREPDPIPKATIRAVHAVLSRNEP